MFEYAKHNSPMIFGWTRWLWNESFRQKRSEGQNFRHLLNPIEPQFLRFFYVSFNIFTSTLGRLIKTPLPRGQNLPYLRGGLFTPNSCRLRRQGELCFQKESITLYKPANIIFSSFYCLSVTTLMFKISKSKTINIKFEREWYLIQFCWKYTVLRDIFDGRFGGRSPPEKKIDIWLVKNEFFQWNDIVLHE